ncbi:MAG: hypothetical protein WC506_07025 [Candidatus Micrarchaeia archaeon]
MGKLEILKQPDFQAIDPASEQNLKKGKLIPVKLEESAGSESAAATSLRQNTACHRIIGKECGALFEASPKYWRIPEAEKKELLKKAEERLSDFLATGYDAVSESLDGRIKMPPRNSEDMMALVAEIHGYIWSNFSYASTNTLFEAFSSELGDGKNPLDCDTSSYLVAALLDSFGAKGIGLVVVPGHALLKVDVPGEEDPIFIETTSKKGDIATFRTFWETDYITKGWSVEPYSDDNSAVHFVLGWVYAASPGDKFDQNAIAEFERALELNPKNGYASAALGFQYLHMANAKDNEILELRIDGKLTKKAEEKIGKEQALLYKKAVDNYNFTARLGGEWLEPNDAVDWNYAAGRIENDKKAYNEYLETASEFLKNAKAYGEALKLYSKLLKPGPKYAAVNEAMGDCYVKLGDYKSAFAHYEKAMGIKTDDERLLVDVAMSYSQAGGDFLEKKAFDIEMEAAKGRGGTGLAAQFLLVGNAYRFNGQKEVGRRYLDQAVQMLEKQGNSTGTLAIAYEQVARIDSKDESSKTAAVDYYCRSAGIYASHGELQKAMDNYVNAIELDPRDKNAIAGLAEFARKEPGFVISEIGKANEKEIEAIESQKPYQAGVAYYAAGVACIAAKDYAGAEKWLGRAMKVAPNLETEINSARLEMKN